MERSNEVEGLSTPSKIRTVIAADFGIDGYAEYVFNYIGQPNRMVRHTASSDWRSVNLGSAEELPGLGTGAAIADWDGEGVLELMVIECSIECSIERLH